MRAAVTVIPLPPSQSLRGTISFQEEPTLPAPQTPEERLAVIEDWRSRVEDHLTKVEDHLTKLDSGQTDLAVKFDLIHRTVQSVDARLKSFPTNGSLAGLVKLGKYADQIASFMDNQDPQAKQLNDYVAAHADEMIRFVETAGPLIDLIERRKDKLIFWAIVRRWSRWDAGLKKLVQLIVAAAITALATAEIWRVVETGQAWPIK